MSTSAASVARAWPRAISLSLDRDGLHVQLQDGRAVSVPLDWFPWLAAASDDDRQDFRLIEDGRGIWWDRIDEGLSVPGLLGLPESAPRQILERYVIEYRLEGSRWVAELPDLDSSTWGRTLIGAKREGRAVLATLLGVEDLGAAGIEVVDEVHSTAATTG
jgi:hypothetical protein